jgi:hypothetical protein
MHVYALINCVHPFTPSRAFEDHFTDCSKHVYQVTKYPEPQSDESIVKWKSREKTEHVLGVSSGRRIEFYPKTLVPPPSSCIKLQMHAGEFYRIFQTKINTLTPAFMPVNFVKVPNPFDF